MRAEIQQRATSLRTLTQGRDTMSVRSGHYDEVPALVQQQILEGWAPKGAVQDLAPALAGPGPGPQRVEWALAPNHRCEGAALPLAQLVERLVAGAGRVGEARVDHPPRNHVPCA